MHEHMKIHVKSENRLNFFNMSLHLKPSWVKIFEHVQESMPFNCSNIFIIDIRLMAERAGCHQHDCHTDSCIILYVRHMHTVGRFVHSVLNAQF